MIAGDDRCIQVSQALTVLLSELHFPSRAIGPITEARDLLVRAALEANAFYATERDQLVAHNVVLTAERDALRARLLGEVGSVTQEFETIRPEDFEIPDNTGATALVERINKGLEEIASDSD